MTSGHRCRTRLCCPDLLSIENMHENDFFWAFSASKMFINNPKWIARFAYNSKTFDEIMEFAIKYFNGRFAAGPRMTCSISKPRLCFYFILLHAFFYFYGWCLSFLLDAKIVITCLCFERNTESYSRHSILDLGQFLGHVRRIFPAGSAEYISNSMAQVISNLSTAHCDVYSGLPRWGAVRRFESVRM